MATPKVWSGKHDWRARAAEHDRQVEGGNSARLHEAQVTERVDTALDFHRGSAAPLAWVMSRRDRVKVETAADVAVLANVAIGLSQQALEIEHGSDLGSINGLVHRSSGRDWPRTGILGRQVLGNRCLLRGGSR